MNLDTSDDVATRQPGWIVASVRVPSTPTRHRVAVWRELRRVGAAAVGQGVWVLPDVPSCLQAIERIRTIAADGDGDVIVLDSRGRSDQDTAKLEELFARAREDDWKEFVADCAKFEAEIDREIAKQKFTLAELEEEEQSLDRLRRWHRDLKKRDVFGVKAGEHATIRLRECNDRLETFADHVYAAVQSV